MSKMAAAVAASTNFLSRRLNACLSAVSSRSHVGYLPFEGRFPNITNATAVAKAQIKAINFKPVKRVVFKVDPLHRKSASIRNLMTIVSDEKVSKTGLKTIFKYNFVSDRCDPTLTLTFHDNDTKVVFETANLTDHEVIYEMNKIVLPLVKEEVVKVADAAAAGQSGKKKGAKK